MKAVFLRNCAILLSFSLTACATDVGGGGRSDVEVTRFHLGQQVARGPIAVEAFDAADANSIEFRSYSAAVARELSRLGWTVTNVGTSEQVALVDVAQGTREGIARRSPVTIGIGGGTGGYGGGIGLGASFGLGGNRSSDVLATMLSVRIKRRSDGTVFWEGRATGEERVGREPLSQDVPAEKLATALFRDFPGESGRTIRTR